MTDTHKPENMSEILFSVSGVEFSHLDAITMLVLLAYLDVDDTDLDPGEIVTMEKVRQTRSLFELDEELDESTSGVVE